jgi:hypothetical protein
MERFSRMAADVPGPARDEDAPRISVQWKNT